MFKVKGSSVPKSQNDAPSQGSLHMVLFNEQIDFQSRDIYIAIIIEEFPFGGAYNQCNLCC
jgi:hypothetical protein